MNLGTRFLSLLLVLAVASQTVMADDSARIPDKFIGKFKLEKSENFDEFLTSKGIGWVLRKMMALASLTKVFKHSESSPHAYDADNLSLKKDTHYENWKLGKPFRAEGFDGKIHEITFTYDPMKEALYEKHVRVDNPQDSGETYSYTVEDGFLVMTMKNKEIICKRYFTRQ